MQRMSNGAGWRILAGLCLATLAVIGGCPTDVQTGGVDGWWRWTATDPNNPDAGYQGVGVVQVLNGQPQKVAISDQSELVLDGIRRTLPADAFSDDIPADATYVGAGELTLTGQDFTLDITIELRATAQDGALETGTVSWQLRGVQNSADLFSGDETSTADFGDADIAPVERSFRLERVQ